MTPAKKALVILIVSTMGLWGCAKGTSADGSAGLPERIRGLEAKVSKLQEDFRAAAAARDQLRAQLSTLEEQRTLVEKERDELKQQLTARTGERDAVHSQYEQFRKGVKTLLNQADVAAGSLPNPAITVSVEETVKPGKS